MQNTSFQDIIRRIRNAPASSNSPPGGVNFRPQNSRTRRVTVGQIILALLVICLLIIGAFWIGRSSGSSAGQSQTTQTNANNHNNQQPNGQPVVDPTPTPTEWPTLSPTPTPTPQPLPYQADWSNGFNGWSGDPDWQVYNGMLINNGGNSNDISPTIVAPFQVQTTADYAVEIELQVVRGTVAYDFATVRTEVTANGWQGYKATVDSGELRINAGISPFGSLDTIARTAFDPGTDWHTYRFEAKGTTLSLYVDNVLKLQASDNRYLTGGSLGLKSYQTQLNIRSFKVFAV